MVIAVVIMMTTVILAMTLMYPIWMNLCNLPMDLLM
jgi:hypothetical protein